ncbi:MAG: MOSC domain-containing protein [Gammaproteobacteria bacterium]
MLKKLLENHPNAGELVWIGVRPEKNQPLLELQQVQADCHSGLLGDHYSGKNGKRQVTLFQWEYLSVLTAIINKPVSPGLVRRNLVIKGINLHSLKQQNICIGEVVLHITGLCHPCSRMEQVLGFGGYNAMRSHGGVTAQIIERGLLKLGDRLTVLPNRGKDTGCG